MSHSANLNELRDLLRRRFGAAVSSAVAPRCPRIEEGCPSWVPSGLAAGEISEWVAVGDGSGATELALFALRQQLATDGRTLIVDPAGELSPLALGQREWKLSRLVFAQVRDHAEALWAIEQGLRSGGVDAVWCRLEALAPMAFRRLKIAAETGGSRCLLMRGREALRATSWADARLLLSPLSSPSWRRRQIRVEVLKVRNGVSGWAVHVELDNETGAVRMVSELASSADCRRATGA